MRKPNSKSEFSSERNETLLNHFRQSLSRQSVISAKRAFQDAAEAPAPRFWVSEARACRIISLMFKGVDLTQGMIKEKREMYQEIFRRARMAKSLNPQTPLSDIIFNIVNNPAPRSYISPHSVARIIYSR